MRFYQKIYYLVFQIKAGKNWTKCPIDKNKILIQDSKLYFSNYKIFLEAAKIWKKKSCLFWYYWINITKKWKIFFQFVWPKKVEKKIPLVLILLNKHNKKVWDFFSQLVWPKKFEKQIPFVLISLNRHIKKVGDFFLKLCGLRTFKSQKCLFSNQKGFKVYGKIKIELS